MKTDAQLKKDVLEELKWEPSVRAEDIGVEVKDGIVTLSGHVDTYGEKWNAERATQRVAGIQGVAVDMGVNLPFSHKRTDADLAQSVKNTLQWTAYLPKDSIKIMVENGYVTLSGAVDWDYQRKSAHNAVCFMFGVTGVSNQISVKHNESSKVIKTEIENVLKRREQAKENHINVDVIGHDVTLSGSAPNWWERELVLGSVWGTAGVWNVTDNISIVR